MQFCFFEDNLCTNFHPLTLSRPTDDLRLGILTIAEKWHHALDDSSWSRIARSELQGIFSNGELDASKPCLWLNSRYLPSEPLLDKVKNMDTGTCIKEGQSIVAASVDAHTSQKWLNENQPDFSSLLVLEGVGFQSITHLWDLLLMNAEEIAIDINRLNSPSSNNHSVSSHAIFENRDQIYIGEGATIEPGAILMANEGPIYIGKNATIMAGAAIKGPVSIGDKSTIKMGAKIYSATTIGPNCKASGEINNSILHSYSNKGHDGYIGNTLIGQWCNLGADTNISNLKNNYSTIRTTDWQSGNEIETGQQFLGAVLADHTKTAINAQFNTGTICGVSCNIFAGDFPPKFIPSFSWVGSNVIQPYKVDKALEAMEAMMWRRDVPLTDPYKQLMKYLFVEEHG